MKKFRRSKKALSPVIATIILIAVTVAISIAVAIWMGALSVGFMQTEQLSITSATFAANDTSVTLAVSNTGTTSVTVNQVWNGNVLVTPTYGGNMTQQGALATNAQGTVTITYQFLSGNNYAFKLVTTKGNSFEYTAIAP
jgi:flagellin-like protein